MGACYALCASGNNETIESVYGEQADVTSLINSENLTAEAVAQTPVPAPPLLKEINFAAIDDDNDDDDGSELDDDDVAELLAEEEEEDIVE